jgi:hypothetical protein
MLIKAFISFSLHGILGSLRFELDGKKLGPGSLLLVAGPTDAVAVPPLPNVYNKG